MFKPRDTAADAQPQFWVETKRLPKATASTFYRKLDETLDRIGFTEGVREICQPAYADSSRGGRPGIDPAVYFKMLMIGFFENLPSERSIASRCADSLSLRAFLGYQIDQDTPDHSSLSVIRNRLGEEIYQSALELVLKGLRDHGLLKGRHLGIDSSVIEANASLRELVHRNTEEQYWDYVKRLAAAAGIDPDDTKAVRQFDRKREGRSTSNQEWVNPHDPDAKVGVTKHGACDMIYKPEHITDLESGAIVAATVRHGNDGDTKELTSRVLAAGTTLARVCDDPKQEQVLRSLTADEGYFSALGNLRTPRRKHPCHHRRSPRQPTPQGKPKPHRQTSPPQGPPRREERQRQSPAAQTRPIHRTQLRPRPRPRRTETHHPAGKSQSHQTATRRGARLRPLTADAQAHRLRHAQTVAGRGPWGIFRADRMADAEAVAARQGSCRPRHRFSVNPHDLQTR
ncbi:MAG: transposase, partial [Luteolibacter sp.]|uniref:transposase n=1 Tax=Luteolibacter sp. TaxID=1962973 RepID=UPI003262E360